MIYAEIGIYGKELIPNDITTILGIEATKSWKAGDFKTSRSQILHKEGCWKFCTEENEEKLQNHLDLLRSVFSKKSDLIRSLAARGFSVELSVVMHVDEHAPEINLDEPTIRWLSDINSSFDVDLYLEP